MFTLCKSLTLKELLFRQAPILLLSFVIAELFYKFHSFTLETIAFLATWAILDGIAELFRRSAKSGSQP